MAGQKFTLSFDAQLNVSQMKGAISQIQSTLNGLHLPANITKDLQTTFNKLSEEVKNFEILSNKDITGKADFSKLAKSAEKVVDLFNKLKTQVSDLGASSNSQLEKMFPENVTKNIQAATTALTEFNNKVNKTNSDIKKAQNDVDKYTRAISQEKAKTVVGKDEYDQITEGLRAAEAEITDYKNKLAELNAQQAELESKLAQPGKSSTYRNLIKEISEVEQKLQTAEQAANKFAQQKVGTTTFEKHTKDLANLESKLTEAQGRLESFQNALNQLQSTAEGGGLKELLDLIGQLTGLDMSKFSADAAGAGEALRQYFGGALNQLRTDLDGVKTSLDTEGAALEKNKSDVDACATSYQQFEDRMRDVSALKSRIQYFFGLNNAINLVKRAIRGAFDTIKELDKAMTETAVVTNYTVKDMWEQLPEYTKRANELGVTTKDAYESATLYFQQGLNADQAAALSTETLKMARIAGLDAAEATDRMTNALRGFNMALDEQSAQRVDDVYSQLAAHTASNVDEISTAMTKVASLAHNANMEFETTAAFLAQIIETTRESAETAGTALKTVVARFSEVKKLVDEGTLRGTDEEGQAIDVNKVGAALRTAGIDLNKYFLGEVGLDDIFVELASKWDSLTAVQQRYIATQAAGSRQQSRFIALMQDYARTQELVGMAYDSEGASQKQFEKTQDSLQSKLARLKNAWDQFLMGLTNNVVVKGFVDLLTNLLNAVNNLTSAFGEGAGSILKWIAAISAFAGIKGLFKGGGFIDKLLMTALSGTGLGNAAVKSGLLSGLLFGGGKISGLTPEQTERANALQNRRGVNIFGGIGNIGKGLWNGAQLLGNWAGSQSGLLGKAAGRLDSFIMKKGAIAGLSGEKLTALASGLTGMSTAIIAIGAAVGAAVLAYKAWLNLTPEGKLKKATKQAEELKKQAEESQKELDSLNNLEDTYKEKTEQVESATTIEDKAKAIEERNKAILDAIEENGTLAKYVTTTRTEFGIELTVNEESLSNAIKDISKAAQEAAINSQYGNAAVDYAQAQVDKKQLHKIWAKSYEGYTAEPTTVEEYYKEILKNGSEKDIQKASEIYQSYLSSIGSAQKQAEIAYGQDLTYKGVSKDLTNALIPALGEAFARTGKKLTDTQLDSILKLPESQLTSILNAYNGKIGEGQSLINFNLEKSLPDLLGISNLEELTDIYSTLETTLKLEEGSILKVIKANAALTKQAQEQVTKNATLQMVKNGKYSPTQIAQYLSLGKFEYQDYINNLLTQLEDSSFGDEIVSSVLSSMYDQTWEDSSLQKWIDNIDFSNPITSFAEIEKAAKNNAEPAIQALAKSIQADGQYITEFSAQTQLSYFTLSESFDAAEESLQKFIDENGEITSSNILEVAESNSTLNQLLKNNVISAKALAVAFTGLQKGKFTILDLNDSILQALNSMDDLDSIVKRTIDDLNSFDPGYDENDVTSFISKVFDLSTEQIEKGAWGNNQMRKYMEYIFGGYSGAPGQEYQDWLTNNMTWLEANKDNMKSAWMDIAGSSKESAIEYGEGVKVWQENGEVLIDIANHNTQELIDIIGNGTSLTEQQLNMMIADYKNYSDNFALTLEQADTQKAVETWAKNIGEQGWYLDKDLKTLADALGVDVNKIKDIVDGLGKTEIKWGEGSLKDIQRILKETGNDKYRTTRKEAFNISDKSINNQNGQYYTEEVINFNQLKQSMMDANLAGYFETTLNQMAKDSGAFVAEFNGQIKNVGIQAGETAIEAYNRVAQETAQEALVGKFGQAVGAELLKLSEDSEINITFLPNKDKIDAFMAEDHDTNAEVNYTANFSNVGTPPVLTGTVVYKPKIIKGGITQESEAKGGTVGSYGSGSNRVKPGPALTGEEGPEIVWNKEKGYAYITGEDHPQFQNLKPGDRIFNAQETKKILGSAANGGMVHSYADIVSGYGDAKIISKNKDAVKEKEKTSDEWKNELDWLYNLMEDIVELERDQKKFEEEFEDILTDDAKTSKDLYNLLIQRLGNLNVQLDRQTFALQKREQEMREFMDTTNDQDQYLWYNWSDRTLEIDWDAIDKIVDGDVYKHVKDLISEAEEIQGKMDDAEDAIQDIKNQIQELENIWRDTYVDFEKRVLDALVKSYQQVIDNYSTLNDTINNSNNEILEAIQNEIDLQRQIRDNTETESDIADKEARLAYLQRDTTGANAQEILQLQKELDTNRQDYEDSLIDQAIQRLQDDNDEAAKQRDKQIEIMQAQLDYQKENGEFNDYISNLISSALSPDGTLLTTSELYELLNEQENWEAMSATNKQVWEEELRSTFKEVGAYLLKTYADWNGEFYRQVAESINTINEQYQINVGSYSQAQAGGSSGSGSGGGGGGNGSGNGGNTNTGSGEAWVRTSTYTYDGDSTGHWKVFLEENTKTGAHRTTADMSTKSAHVWGNPTIESGYYYYTCTVCGYRRRGDSIKPSQQEQSTTNVGAFGADIKKTGSKNKKYATGGLNTQTGLAWLDGTPSEPEYVLNARQTQAFLKLADVLPAAINGSAPISNSYSGDIYLNLDMHVDEIADDYDVDRIANRVKDILYDASSYRNVNTINFIR